MKRGSSDRELGTGMHRSMDRGIYTVIDKRMDRGMYGGG
jgi:hypothetical protein